MRIFLARLFRLLFKLSFFRSRHFGFYKKIFKPWGWFDHVACTVRQDGFTLRLQIDDWIQHKMYFLGGYEEPELQAVKKLLKEGDVFIDAGANIGLFSLYASRWVGKSGMVISFEPLSVNYSSLTNHIQLNNLTNIKPEQLALGNKNGLVAIVFDPDEKNRGMASTAQTGKGLKEKIRMVTLDAYLQGKNFNRIDFIKIDIEGQEYAALTGMYNTLKKYKPALLIEVLEDKDIAGNEQNIHQYLADLGYKKYYIDDQGNISETEENPQRRNFLFSAVNF